MTERLLAGLALVLAMGALIVGSPRPEENVEGVGTVGPGPARMDPVELARMLRDGSDDVRIVDLRSPAAYRTFHLPGAERTDLSELVAGEPVESSTVVVYHSDAPTVERAWRRLRARGHRRVRVLDGGAAAWIRQVMMPVLPRQATERERQAFEEVAELSRYFGGDPRIGERPDGWVVPGEGASDSVVQAVVQDARRRGCGW